MTRVAFLAVLLVLAVGPRAGAAQGTFADAPAEPLIQGFTGLFHSPPAPVIRMPSTPSPLAASGPTMPSRPQPTNTLGTNADSAICRPALIAAEIRHGIPVGLLQAIGIVESGRRDPLTGKAEPWPWTVNADGEPHIFDNKLQAVDWVRQAQGRGVQSIDVGCAQVNLMYHPTAFASLEQAFDPATNTDYAARFLRELWDTTANKNWMTAAGQYHSQTPDLADTYREQVRAAMAGGAAPNSHREPHDADRFLGTGPIIWRIPIAAGSRPGGTDGHNRARVGCLSRYADPDGVGCPSSFDGDTLVGARSSSRIPGYPTGV
jgi:hypothetical protein